MLSSPQVESEATDGVSTRGEGVLPPTFPAPPALARQQLSEESSIARPRRRGTVPPSAFPESVTAGSLGREQLVQLQQGEGEQDGRAVGVADQVSAEP